MTYYFARYNLGTKYVNGPTARTPAAARKALRAMINEHRDTLFKYMRFDLAPIEVREFRAPETLK